MQLNNFRNYLCWIFISVFYLFENCLIVSQGILGPSMQAELGITDTQLALLASAFYWSYSLMQIPVGVILDRFGVRIPLLTAIAICICGVYLSYRADSFLLEFLARLLIGFGASFVVLSSLNFSAVNFSKNIFATLTGLLLTIGMSGQILGEAPLLSMINNIGWRPSLLALTYVGIFIFIFLVLFLPRQRPDRPEIRTLKNDLKIIYSNSIYWRIAIYGMLRFTPFSLFASFWGAKLIPILHNISIMQAATIVGMLPLGFAIGAPIWGFISDKSGKRLPGLIISNILELILWSIIFIKIGYTNLNVVVCLLGFSISGFLPAFSLMKETADENIRSSALGFMNTFNSIATPMVLPLMSLIHANYSSNITLMVLPVISFCAIVSFKQLKEANV